MKTPNDRLHAAADHHYWDAETEKQLLQALAVDLTRPADAAAFNAIAGNPGLANLLERAHADGWFAPRLAPSTMADHKKKVARVQRVCKEFGIPFDPITEAGMLTFCMWLRSDPADVSEDFRIPSDKRRKKPTSPQVVKLYVEAVDAYHRRRGFPKVKTHTVDAWLKGYAREWARNGGSPPGSSLAITPEHLRSFVDCIDSGGIDWAHVAPERNELRRAYVRLFLTWGFVGMLRPGELLAIETSWITVQDGGLDVRLPRRKGRPHGRLVHLPAIADTKLCPVRGFVAYIDSAKPFGGLRGSLLLPVIAHNGPTPFRESSGPQNAAQNISRAIRRIARQTDLGFDPDLFCISPYSMRRGGATTAYAQASELDRDIVSAIRRHLGHRHFETTRMYVEDNR